MISTTMAGKLVPSDLAYAVELVREAMGMAGDEDVRWWALNFLVSNGRIRFLVTNTYLVSYVRRVVDFQKMDWSWGKPGVIGVELLSFLVLLRNSHGRWRAGTYLLAGVRVEKFQVEDNKMVYNTRPTSE